MLSYKFIASLLCLGFCASSVSALEDPRTTRIKAELIAFCQSLNGELGTAGTNCFDISGPFHSAILAAKAQTAAGACERSDLADQLLANFGGHPGVAELAEEMRHAPINVIPPRQLPGVDPPCVRGAKLRTRNPRKSQ
ncbi:hypothetical protein SpCBS45565_g00391 [Spizellomyces sp. 'palustris']|nr:hypothetical protein SpCBS45565_g00391 [Spizellomyces sp. 'palustris']